MDGGDSGVVTSGYHLLGFVQTPTAISSVPTYDYDVPGTPTDFDVIEDAFLGMSAPQQVVAIDVANVQNAAPVSVPFRPDRINTYVLPGVAPPPTIADSLVGEGASASLYERLNYVTGTFVSGHTAAPLAGSVIALSGAPTFAQASIHDAAVLTASGTLYWIDFGQTTPALNHQVTLGSLGLGVALDVSAGDDFAFVTTSGPNRLSRLTTPILGNLSSTAPLVGVPVAVGGSEKDLLVVVAERAVNSNRLEAFFPLNLAFPAPSVLLPGEPVAIVVRTIGQGQVEFVWVATKNPNEVRLYSVTGAGFSLVANLSLGSAMPLRLRVGLTNSPLPLDGGPNTDPTLSGLVHVLVKQ